MTSRENRLRSSIATLAALVNLSCAQQAVLHVRVPVATTAPLPAPPPEPQVLPVRWVNGPTAILKGKAWLFDFRRERLTELVSQDGDFVCLALSPTKRHAVTIAQTGTLVVWDAATARPVLRHSGNRLTYDQECREFQWNKQEDQLLTKSSLLDLTADKRLHLPTGELCSPSAGGKYVFHMEDTNSNDPHVLVRRAEDLSVVLRVAGSLGKYSFSPDDRFLAVSPGYEQSVPVQMWDLEMRRLRWQGAKDRKWLEVWSPDGQYILSTCGERTTAVLRASNGKQVACWSHVDSTTDSSDATSLVWHPTTGVLYDFDLEHLRMWVPEQKKPRIVADRMQGELEIPGLVWSPDYERVASGFRIWTHAGHELFRSKSTKCRSFLEWSPDAKHALISCESDDKVVVHGDGWTELDYEEPSRLTMGNFHLWAGHHSIVIYPQTAEEVSALTVVDIRSREKVQVHIVRVGDRTCIGVGDRLQAYCLEPGASWGAIAGIVP